MELVKPPLNNFKTKHYHFFFLFIVLTHYYLSFFLFNSLIFATEIDTFDSEILFNKIIGQIFRSDFYIADSLLNGEYKWYYFTRIFYITNILYSFLSVEFAFLFLDLAIKIFAYISFYKLSRLIRNRNIFSFLLATIYSYTATTAVVDYHSSIYGLGAAVIPYLSYLILKNKELKIKNYFFIIFAALNSHFYFALSLWIVPFVLYFYEKKINLKLSGKVIFPFLFFCVLVNSNILYIALFNEIPLNRDFWVDESFPVLKNIKLFFQNLFYDPIFESQITFPEDVSRKIIYLPLFLKKIPISIFYTLAIFLLIFNKIKKRNLFLKVIILIPLVCFIEKTSFYTNFVNNLDLGIIKSIQLSRLKLLLSFFILFAIANVKNEVVIKKLFIIVLVSVVILFQVNKMVVPFLKNTINYTQVSKDEKIKLKNYFINLDIINLIKLTKTLSGKEKKEKENFLTFKDYYNSKNFLKIKNIVKDSYVLPVNIDPAKLIFNDIKVLGGYFQFYPLSFKKNFEEIIKGELDINKSKKNEFERRFYLTKSGHRLYAFVNNPNDLKINLDKTKKMGAQFVISTIKLNHDDLLSICENCNGQTDIHLYSIN